MVFITCWTDEIPPDLRELVEHEEDPQEPGNQYVWSYPGDLRVGFGNHREIGTFGTP